MSLCPCWAYTRAYSGWPQLSRNDSKTFAAAEAQAVKGGDRGDPPSREIGKLSQIQQSEVSHLMNGRFKRFSEGKL
jgi:hypothetical protein